MDLHVAEDQPAWDHALHAQEALVDFIAHMEAQNIDYRNPETTEQATEWPFGEYPQVEAVQVMYRPEPKQMPNLCFGCSQTGKFFFFVM